MYNRALVLGLLAVLGTAFAYSLDIAGFRYYVDTFLRQAGIVKFNYSNTTATISSTDSDAVILSNI
jgi:hypothetical protein